MVEPIATISVVIPAFDAERVIPRAIESARRQRVAPDEILVVDDGSTDGTARIAEAQGAPVRCIRQANGGASSARNRGIGEARGEWVAFLDADDEWEPGHLERAFALLREHPDLVWTSCAYRWQRRGDRAEDISLAVTGVADFFALVADADVVTPSMVVRRSVLGEVGGFDPSLPTSEDRDLWFRIALRHPEIGYVGEPGVTVWGQEGSLTTRGLYTAGRALEFVTKADAEAGSADPEVGSRARPIVTRWTRQALRLALLSGDRDVARRIHGRFPEHLSPTWKLAAGLCVACPPPLWRAAVALWAGFRDRRLGRATGEAQVAG